MKYVRFTFCLSLCASIEKIDGAYIRLYRTGCPHSKGISVEAEVARYYGVELMAPLVREFEGSNVTSKR
jgi:hypothetical protein